MYMFSPQIAADRVFTWYPGGALPCLCPLADETASENAAEESDTDVVKRDVIEVCGALEFY